MFHPASTPQNLRDHLDSQLYLTKVLTCLLQNAIPLSFKGGWPAIRLLNRLLYCSCLHCYMWSREPCLVRGEACSEISSLLFLFYVFFRARAQHLSSAIRSKEKYSKMSRLAMVFFLYLDFTSEGEKHEVPRLELEGSTSPETRNMALMATHDANKIRSTPEHFSNTTSFAFFFVRRCVSVSCFYFYLYDVCAGILCSADKTTLETANAFTAPFSRARKILTSGAMTAEGSLPDCDIG